MVCFIFFGQQRGRVLKHISYKFGADSNSNHHRPLSSNAEWEAAAPPDMPFDYDAQPSTFYFDVESVGNHEPDAIVQQSISVLQRKLAETISALTGAGEPNEREGLNGVDVDGARSPDAYEPPEGIDGGYSTYAPDGVGAAPGGQSVWGAAGGTTPYGATPYGQGYGF